MASLWSVHEVVRERALSMKKAGTERAQSVYEACMERAGSVH